MAEETYASTERHRIESDIGKNTDDKAHVYKYTKTCRETCQKRDIVTSLGAAEAHR